MQLERLEMFFDQFGEDTIIWGWIDDDLYIKIWGIWFVQSGKGELVSCDAKTEKNLNTAWELRRLTSDDDIGRNGYQNKE